MAKVIHQLCLSFGDTFLQHHQQQKQHSLTGAHTMAGIALQTSCIKYTSCVQIIIDHFNKYHEEALYVHLYDGQFFSHSNCFMALFISLSRGLFMVVDFMCMCVSVFSFFLSSICRRWELDFGWIHFFLWWKVYTRTHNETKREEKKTNNARDARSMSAELKRKFIKLMFQSHRIELNAKITAL